MADTEIQRLESYQYPNTHVGHLSPQHQQALESFKQLCEQKGYYSSKGENGLPSHDDETMLRYLRARKFNSQDAFHQFKDTEDWRKENQIDKVYDTIDVQEYDEARRLYPQWTGRRDRRGIPVYVFEVAHLNSKAVAAYESSTTSKNSAINLTSKVPQKMLRLFALYENLVNFALPLCSALPDRAYPETPVSQSSNIVDISNVGLRQFWSLKNHMQDASQLATAHYPETLDRIFIIGAPSFFPTVWGWIKRWFDPITVSKIFILSKEDMKPTLEQYMDPENIPKKYGGKLDYKFGDLPNFDSSIHKALKWSAPEKLNGYDTMPTGPIRWERYENGNLAAVAVGTEDGKPRNKKIAVLTPSSNVVQTSLGAGHQGHQLFRTTSGVETHPPTPPVDQIDIMEPTREESPAGANRSPSTVTKSPLGVAQPLSTDAPGGTYLDYSDAAAPTATATDTTTTTTTLPYRDGPPATAGVETADNATTHHPSVDRQGTSSTRYAGQSHTHAHGDASAATPLTAGAAGDNYGVMEPNTVGQAPKEHPMPEGAADDGAASASYLDQAKQMAGQALETAAAAGSTALAAVGVSSASNNDNKTAEEDQASSVPRDPRVEQVQPEKVEDFLRAKYPSEGTTKEADAKI